MGSAVAVPKSKKNLKRNVSPKSRNRKENCPSGLSHPPDAAVGRKGADSNDSIINTREFFVSSALRIPPRLPCARRSRAVAPHLHSQVPLCPASVFALHIASQGAARGMLSGRYLYQTDLPAARPRRCADPCRFVAADSPSQSVCHAPPPATRPVWATRCRAGRPGFVPQAPELERTSITVTTVANAKPWP